MLSERDLELADEIFESTAKHLLDKKASLFNKYRYLLFKESMVRTYLKKNVSKYLEVCTKYFYFYHYVIREKYKHLN